MHVINARNVHEALPLAIHYIVRHGHKRDSRAGEVLVAPHPVTTLYQAPFEMCCLWPERDVNPFGTLFEGLWMLAGRQDVAFPARFIPRMREFSDDGVTMHGAYGHRWRKKFGIDQIETIAAALRADSTCRRQVLQIWDSHVDLGREGRDFPCNTLVHFQVSVFGALDMTVFNRSNDLVWGTYGADAPHFGMLLQYMAKKVGIPVGRYWQVSDNWHAYVKTLAPIMSLQTRARVEHYELVNPWSPYDEGLQALNMMHGLEDGDTAAWDADLEMFLDEGENAMGYQTYFFKKVAVPLLQAHVLYKSPDSEDDKYRFRRAIAAAETCRAEDWRRMAVDWLERRLERYLA